MFRILCLALTIAFAPAVTAFAQTKKSAPTRPPYKGYAVMDAASGEIIAQENATLQSPPASVTKLMTFLVVHDRIAAGQLSLTTPVQVMVEDSKIGGTQVWLDPRETFSVEELLYALMVQSANDAATALARAAAGSRAGFVEMMNARAQALGMTDTVFRTPHGLPPSTRKLSESDLTTPRDLALLSRELLLKTDVLKYSSVKERSFGGDQREAPVIMRTHNHLVGKVAGVDGLKTGYTASAGFCLASTAQRDSRRIIVTIMGSPSSKERDLKVTELIEAHFHKIPATSRFVPAKPFTPATSGSSALITSAVPPSLITPAEETEQADDVTPPPPAGAAPAAVVTPEQTPTAPLSPNIRFKIPSSGKPGKTNSSP